MRVKLENARYNGCGPAGSGLGGLSGGRGPGGSARAGPGKHVPPEKVRPRRPRTGKPRSCPASGPCPNFDLYFLLQQPTTARMQHARNVLLAAAAYGAIAVGCATFKPATPMPENAPDPAWAAIDSLVAIGQYATALTATDSLLDTARSTADWRTEFRAWMYKGRLMPYTGTDAKDVLAAMEARAAQAGTPLAPLLHSVIAEQWWTYYQGQRWRVLERPPLAEPTDDPEAWDQATFMQQVIHAYTASLQPPNSLARIPVGELGPLLQPAHADTLLRPTPFDVL